METLIYIGKRLREERERLGLSQSDFAEIAEKKGVAGATRQSQSNYEKGKQAPSAAYLAAIAVEGADVQYILTGARAMSWLPTPAIDVKAAKVTELFNALDKKQQQEIFDALEEKKLLNQMKSQLEQRGSSWQPQRRTA